MATIEQNLREICKAKGLKLSDIADRIGTTVSNLLVSVKGNPTITKLQDIANALQVPVADLVADAPAKPLGLIYINGSIYQLSAPSENAVQLPIYDRYDNFRKDAEEFIKKSVESDKNDAMMGMIEQMEVFSIFYDGGQKRFNVSICYSTGKTMAFTYDKYAYADWKEGDTDETVAWNLPDVIEDIINDVEGAVMTKQQSV